MCPTFELWQIWCLTVRAKTMVWLTVTTGFLFHKSCVCVYPHTRKPVSWPNWSSHPLQHPPHPPFTQHTAHRRDVTDVEMGPISSPGQEDTSPKVDYWKRGRQSSKHCLQATDWWGKAVETSPGWVTKRSRDRCWLALKEAAPSFPYMFGGAWASIVLFRCAAPPQARVHLRHHLPLLHGCDRHACHFTLHLRPCGNAAVEACAGPSLSLSRHGAWGCCCKQNKAEYTAFLTAFLRRGGRSVKNPYQKLSLENKQHWTPPLPKNFFFKSKLATSIQANTFIVSFLFFFLKKKNS